MSNNFWAQKLSGDSPAPRMPIQSPAQQIQQGQQYIQQNYGQPPQYNTNYQADWWQATQPHSKSTADTMQKLNNYVPGRDGPAIEELARMDASTLSGEALEMIAAWKLKKNQKYDNTCPHCFAENGMMQATRNTVARCVECGYSDRLMHQDLQPLTKLRASKDSVHARDFAGSSMGNEGFQHHSAAGYQKGFMTGQPGA